MKQVLIDNGQITLEEVPAPTPQAGMVLVRVGASCISPGTEMSGVKSSGMSLYRRALKQPHNVRRVLNMARVQGVRSTYHQVKAKLSGGAATGYSAMGVVEAMGEDVVGFRVGDRVACAGAGYANHAEKILVPVNLVVAVPQAVSDSDAATVTLGAIALQGVRRAQPNMGERVLVIGLGLLGQLTCRLLAAQGCLPLAVDIDPARLAQCDVGEKIDSGSDDLVDRVMALTQGLGADSVIITASGGSTGLINTAMRATRKKGRIVLVGDVPINIDRAEMYEKELDFLISTSYGPGRYDQNYEENGFDYPPAYVRWTENRNMQAYLEMIARGLVSLSSVLKTEFPIDEAKAAYASIGSKATYAVLRYETEAPLAATRTVLTSRGKGAGRIGIGLVGASGFAQGVHLPNLARLEQDFELRSIVSRSGAKARAVAKQYNAQSCGTDFQEVLSDPDIDVVLIATRHDLHGEMVLEALAAGKHVFVEKPLTLDPQDIDKIETFYAQNPDGPMLCVGYNRRFSPIMQKCRDWLAGRSHPVIINYQMNAGYLPADHWVFAHDGGGRNLGEACHIYDLFNYFVGASPCIDIQVSAIQPQGGKWQAQDNFVASLTYADGSICTLTYTSLGHARYPKETMTVFAGDAVIDMRDYTFAQRLGGGRTRSHKSLQDKGHVAELKALADAVRSGVWPITWQDLRQSSEISFRVEEKIKGL